MRWLARLLDWWVRPAPRDDYVDRASLAIQSIELRHHNGGPSWLHAPAWTSEQVEERRKLLVPFLW